MPQQNNIIKHRRLGLFADLALLTLLLVLFEISIVIRCSGIYLGDFKLIANHLHVPMTVVPGVLYYLFAQCLVHVLFLICVWGTAKFVGVACRLGKGQTEIAGIIIWFVALVTVLLANEQYFPNSKFADLLFSPFPPKWIYYMYVVGCVMLTISLILAMIGFVIYLASNIKRWPLTAVLPGFIAMAAIVSVSYFLSSSRTMAIQDASTIQKPNIILVGVDSLRPDYLSFFGSSLSTPHFDYFLNKASVFAEAITPLARTYPSWVGILSGLYPKKSGVRTNLQDQSHIDFNAMLPHILKQQGYYTVFATDETRFSNIDTRFGFDRVVVPPIGFNDFLLGTSNDFPLSNLLINTVIGKYLFPNSYANRGVYVTYDPDSFLRRVQSTLSGPRHQPIFLAIHFCLPHYPYAWSRLTVHTVSLHHYLAAIQRADQQFHDFMMILKNNKLLEHSIVIFISDHGEGVERPGDRITDPDLFIPGKKNVAGVIPHFYPPTATNEKVNQAGGHGTDVLGLTQYHSVLAFRTFGLIQNQSKMIPGIVSLLDIKPTLLAALHIPIAKMDGVSRWNNVLTGVPVAESQTDLFSESDFSPEAIRSVHPETRKVLFEGIDYFRIDPRTTRILVKNHMVDMIISSKQYADYYGSWVLALYPQVHGMMPILVNLQTGQWTNDLTTPFAEHSPAHHMLNALKSFYGNDIRSSV